MEKSSRFGLRMSSIAGSFLSSMALALALSGAVLAQQPTTAQSPAAQPGTGTGAPQTGANTSQEGHERILGLVPVFEVTNRKRPQPLTSRQKFDLFARQTFDPFQWAAAGAQAGLSQADNTWPGYGQGAAGYGKRYGATMGDVVDREFLSDYLLPVALKQDPRYFRLGQGTIKYRFIYSMEQEFWCRTDQGTGQFNYSKVLGAFAAKTISNVYYPPGDRGFGLTMRNAGVAILSSMATGLATEFWPDVDCRVFHKCGRL
jgi:hypothetical protein